MHDIAHDSIEVADYGGVALVGDDINAILEGVQRIVQLFFLIVGNALVIIKRHLVRIILSGVTTKGNDAVAVFSLPGVAHQLQTGGSIVRSNVECLFQHHFDAILGHLLQIHIGGTE